MLLIGTWEALLVEMPADILKKSLVLAVTTLMATCALAVTAQSSEAVTPSAWGAATPIDQATAGAAFIYDGVGSVYICGGYHSVSAPHAGIKSVYKYDLETGVTTQLADMLTSVVSAAGATTSDGKLYVMGGAGFNSFPSALTQIYDPSTNVWSYGTPMPYGVLMPRAVEYDGLIYVAGGWNLGYYDDTYVYNPGQDSWTSVGDMPVATFGGSMVKGGSYIYYVGGYAGGTASAATYRLNPATGTWSTKASMPEAKACNAAVAGPDGFVYSLGGFSTTSYSGAGSRSAFYYNPFDDEWGSATEIGYNVMHAGAGATSDGRIFLVGGEGDASTLSAVSHLSVMSLSINASPSTVTPGGALSINCSLSYKYASPIGYSVLPKITLPSGDEMAMNGVTATAMSSSSPFWFEVVLPVTVPPGACVLQFSSFRAYYSGGFTELTDFNPNVLPDTVFNVSGVSSEKHLSDQVSELQHRLAQVQAELDSVNAKLNSSSASSQTELDSLKASVETKADSMPVYLAIGLLIVVIVLLSLMIRGRFR